MIAIGSCIGAGIFLTPAKIVNTLPHQGLVLVVWVLGGLIALCGALTFSELGGLFPGTGGVYVFLKKAYGDLTGFLYGWVILLVINTGALGVLSLGFAEYLGYFIPSLSQSVQIYIAIGTLMGLTLINMVGVEVSQGLANIFSGLKLAAIAAIVLVGLLYFDPERVDFTPFSAIPSEVSLVSAVLTALVGVFFSFGGWHHATYLAGEAIDAQRTVPRAMIIGVLVVTITYVLVNVGYMLLLNLPEIAGANRVAGEAIGQVFDNGGKLVAVAIAISIFGTISIYTMTAPRIYFAMASDGLFFPKLAEIHPRFKTPHWAMLFQAGWASILIIFWETFNDLITYVTVVDITFMALAGCSLFVFRKKIPKTKRPYRVVGYPLIPLIYVLISAAFVVNTLFTETKQAAMGFGILLIGIPVYYYFKNRLE